MKTYLTTFLISLCCFSAISQYTFKEHYFNSNSTTNDKINYLEVNSSYLVNGNNFSNEFLKEIYKSGYFSAELKQKVIEGLTPTNSIGFGGLGGLVYKRKFDQFNLRVGLSSQLISNNKFSRDFVKLALNGNAPYTGETLDLGNTSVQIDAFHKLSIGAEKVIKDNFIFGGAVNLYQGYFHFDMDLDRADFFTEVDGSQLKLDTKFDQSYSRPNEKGYGAGLDLYLVSKSNKGNFIVSIEDFGFIRYSNLTKFSADSNFAFAGVEILDIFNSEDGSIGSGGNESIHKFFGIESDSSSKVVFTPAKFTVGMQEQINKVLFMELYMNYQVLANYVPQLIIKPNMFLNRNFSVAPVVTLGGFGKVDVGLNLSYHHSNYFVVLDMFEFENLIAPTMSSGRGTAFKAGLLF